MEPALRAGERSRPRLAPQPTWNFWIRNLLRTFWIGSKWILEGLRPPAKPHNSTRKSGAPKQNLFRRKSVSARSLENALHLYTGPFSTKPQTQNEIIFCSVLSTFPEPVNAGTGSAHESPCCTLLSLGAATRWTCKLRPRNNNERSLEKRGQMKKKLVGNNPDGDDRDDLEGRHFGDLVQQIKLPARSFSKDNLEEKSGKNSQPKKARRG